MSAGNVLSFSVNCAPVSGQQVLMAVQCLTNNRAHFVLADRTGRYPGLYELGYNGNGVDTDFMIAFGPDNCTAFREDETYSEIFVISWNFQVGNKRASAEVPAVSEELLKHLMEVRDKLQALLAGDTRVVFEIEGVQYSYTKSSVSPEVVVTTDGSVYLIRGWSADDNSVPARLEKATPEQLATMYGGVVAHQDNL